MDNAHSGTLIKQGYSFSIFKGEYYSLRIVMRLAKDDVEAQLESQLDLLLGDVDEPLPERVSEPCSQGIRLVYVV